MAWSDSLSKRNLQKHASVLAETQSNCCCCAGSNCELYFSFNWRWLHLAPVVTSKIQEPLQEWLSGLEVPSSMMSPHSLAAGVSQVLWRVLVGVSYVSTLCLAWMALACEASLFPHLDWFVRGLSCPNCNCAERFICIYVTIWPRTVWQGSFRSDGSAYLRSRFFNFFLIHSLYLLDLEYRYTPFSLIRQVDLAIATADPARFSPLLDPSLAPLYPESQIRYLPSCLPIIECV